MRERDHDNVEYEGGPGEKVTIRVIAQGTNHIVTFKLNGGASQVLSAGNPIEFNLKNTSGQRTDLQVFTDGSTPGSYEFVVENVSNCREDLQHIGKCVRSRNAPPKKTTLFAFFVS